jgi:hypothetical protein
MNSAIRHRRRNPVQRAMQAAKRCSPHTSMLEEEKASTTINWTETCIDIDVVPDAERRLM